MAATYMPSNLIKPNPRDSVNPNWTQVQAAVPQSSVFTEAVPDRLMVVFGKHIDEELSSFDSLSTVPFFDVTDNPTQESVATFHINNVNITQCTSIKLERIKMVGLPPEQAGNSSSRNLTNTLCGDYVDNNFDTPRRFVLSDIDMNIPISVGGSLRQFNVESFLPNGRRIAYYRLVDIFTYFVNAWTSYMINVLGDASFFATVYVDNISPRLYWSSPKFGLRSVRLFTASFSDRIPNFWNLLNKHIIFLGGMQSPDTTQVGRTGESIGFMARDSTGLQNNSEMMTIHSNELTLFRKLDSIAPAEGATLIGVVAQNSSFTNGSECDYSAVKGDLTSPKIAFDRTQSLSQFDIQLRVQAGQGASLVKFTKEQMKNISIVAIFRIY